MRQRILVGVRDVKVGEYGVLMVLSTEAEAKRMYLSTLQDNRSFFAKHPHDFTLHVLGLFDPETGRITPSDVPQDVTPYSERDAVLSKLEAERAPQAPAGA